MASNIVFYIDEDPTGSNPSVIYIYDNGGFDSGNLLATVKYETNFVEPSGYTTSNYDTDQNGDLIGYFSHQRPTVIAATPDGRCYAASAPVSVLPEVFDGFYDLYNLDYFRVYRTDGNRIEFPQLHGARIRAIEVDTSGNIYVAGDMLDEVDNYVGGKYNSSGVLQWRLVGSPRDPLSDFPAGRTDTVYCIAVDSSGNVYTGGGNDYEFGVIKKYNSSGTLQWEVNPNNIITHIAVDSSGNVYTSLDGRVGANGIFSGGVTYSNFVAFDVSETYYHIIKWDSSGAFVDGITLDVYGGFDTVDFTTRLFMGDGVLEVTYRDYLSSFFEWTTYNFDLTVNTSHGISRKTMAIAPDGTVYLNQINATTSPGDGGITTYAIETDQVMSLALSFRFGEPTAEGDRYNTIPGLAFNLALAIPVPIREYVGSLYRPAVFSLSLTGGTGTVIFPVSYINIRKSTSGIYISATIPNITELIIDDIESRTSGNLIVSGGIVLPDGNHQLEVIATAPFSSLRYDIGPRSGSLTIDGAGAGESGGYTRIAKGISYRSNTNGKRTIRCLIDNYLKPLDVFDLGASETMIVGQITITISPTSGLMTVTESDE